MTVNLTNVDEPTETIVAMGDDEPRNGASVRAMAGYLTRRSWFAVMRLRELLGTHVAVSGSSAATDVITTATTHGLAADDPVRFQALEAGSLPAPLSASSIYYVLYLTATTFKVANAPGGPAIDITSAGGGPYYVIKVPSAPGLFVPASGTVPAGLLGTLLARFGQLSSTITNTWDSINVFAAKLKMQGENGRFVERPAVTLPDANTNVSVAADTYYIPTLTATRTYTALETSSPTPDEGEEIELICYAPLSQTAVIKRECSGDPMATMNDPQGVCSVRLKFKGVRWVLASYSGGVTPGAQAAP